MKTFTSYPSRLQYIIYKGINVSGGISSDPGCKVVEDSKRWSGDVKQKSEIILKCLAQSFDNENGLDYGKTILFGLISTSKVGFQKKSIEVSRIVF